MIESDFVPDETDNEKGTASILAICLLGIILFFSMAILSLEKNEKDIVVGFSDGLLAQSIAESAAEKAILQLERDASWLVKAKSAKALEPALLVISSKSTENKPGYRVYLTYNDTRYVLMAVSDLHDQQGQVFVYLEPVENGFIVERWEK